MFQVVIRRLVQSVVTILAVITLTFMLFSMIPGNFATTQQAGKQEIDPLVLERMEKELGLNDPLHVRFANYVSGLAVGNLGKSFSTQKPVSEMVLPRVWASFQLAVGAIIIAVGIGVPMGFLAAFRQGGIIDTITMVFATSGLAVPSFWFGLLAMYVFSLKFGLFPTMGSGTPSHYVLPILTLSISPIALLARTTRAAVLETLNADFIRTARSKGASESRIITKHLARNASVLILTVIGLQFAGMLGGSVIVETLYTWPGIGSLLIDSVTRRDIPVAQGCILLVVFFFVLINTLVDLAYLFVDPRIRY